MATKFDAENADNLEDIEKQFAVKAVAQAETYWSLLLKVPGSTLRLTPRDDDIYDTFIEAFPEYKEASRVAKISEDEMKSVGGKAKWREFCDEFKEMDDYNFGTLLRIDASEEYTEKNTIFAVRVQFYAIEIARNRHGLNDWAAKK